MKSYAQDERVKTVFSKHSLNTYFKPRIWLHLFLYAKLEYTAVSSKLILRCRLPCLTPVLSNMQFQDAVSILHLRFWMKKKVLNLCIYSNILKEFLLY